MFVHSPYSHCIRYTMCQNRNGQCNLWTTVAACLCLTFAVFWNGCAGLPPRRSIGIFPSIPRRMLEPGQTIKTQNREKGNCQPLFNKEQNQFVSLQHGQRAQIWHFCSTAMFLSGCRGYQICLGTYLRTPHDVAFLLFDIILSLSHVFLIKQNFRVN